ncbi:AGK_G0028370.mRNA.1.CDS.1 [Saccharomyces cerevisiae]|nr:AGK_G0028370.mRNA.1.CDS.1 [Saccharomyces cerevisiae]CAI5287515.1 BBF_HP2_G0028430.mRNA.1.CDS.1 [Saccharomyces cerevisiae]CAI6582512.1 BBF_HP2_G0028430.mRNA.1.CDS.1 [Saccharomyces cerevisiae]CAI6730734.1 AGK_G0028370.mRNA.1.CDS.1 [Saccharomyces cerevisiae]CAI7170279.1 BBF_collapsed_G0029050.mRNA.1.CDS.1 [Saccharomyces cerevisiae]
MSQVIEPQLDRTTYYSILGLTSNATSSEVHKSYLKLARLLHPDKTKSDKSEELFKAVVHAHSILTDEDQKLRYDRDLKIKGLHTYQPKKNCHIFKTKAKESQGASPTLGQSEAYHRQNKPYEQQPYGFGVGKKMTSSSKSKVPIFKSFNLKSYQRNHYYSSKKERKHGSPDIDSLFHETNGASKVRMTDAGKMDTNSQFQEIWEILGKNAYTHKSYSEDPNSCLGSALSDHEEEEEEEEAGKQQQQQQQHYGMTSKSSSPDEEQKDNKEPKRESRVSPEENGEEETGHKQFKLPKTSTFSSGSHDSNLQSPFYNHEYRHYARSKFECKNQFRRSVSPIKEIPATASTNEGWNILRDIIEKLNISNVDDRNKDLLFRRDEIGDKNHSDSIDIENLSIKEPKGMKRRKKDDISLEELFQSLPREKDYFMMDAINDSLESINLFKKPKTTQSHEQGGTFAQAESNRAKFKPLLEQCGITPEILDLQIPEIPEFDAVADLETLKLNVQLFNNQCNKLKETIHQVSLQRLRADTQFSDMLTQKQSIMVWKTYLEFDKSLMDKLNILQERQMQVIKIFSERCDGKV